MTEEAGIDEKLHVWFKQNVPELTDLVISNLTRSGEGWSSELYSFVAEWTEHGERVFRNLIVRIDPGRKSTEYYPKSSYPRQFKVLRCIKAANINVPAPDVFWFEEDSSFFGGPFIIMEKLPGRSYIPWAREGRKFFDEAAKSEAPRQFVEFLAELHRLDWERHGLSFLGVPSNEFEQADEWIDRWEGMLDRNAWQPEPIFRDAIYWARRNRPKMERTVFMHGDYRTGNMLFDKTNIVGLVDWEVCEIGDPSFEIGMICSKLNRMDSPLICYLVDREFLYDYYEKLTGWPVNRTSVLFWEVMYALFNGLFWMISVREFVEGKTTDLRKARGFTNYLECKNLVAEYLGY